ncbi:MAG: 5-formyltetrahydrofolate cyclo-ligase [Thermoproteus sp. AZ2]|jgi:5-formyltetrahydrofolate cyclo-ligase|uniref:5-formyltetrahydrofolate cyclo-ligase n=1 Tax=Thermoproteus sp. AZ2 TaxID=1609232 RepID=A0ACC6UYW8_9CREN
MARDPAVVRRKAEIRQRIWDLLERLGVAAFPRPVYGRIPNFRGADAACGRLLSTQAWRRARVVKINPDAPQRPCREAALREGKKLVMPTPRIKNGFLLLDPALIPKSAYQRAATIAGAFDFGSSVDPRDLPAVDLVVIGSVAVNRLGHRLGKSHGYAELEWGILTELGKAGPSTAVATTVHDLQFIDEEIPREPFDLPVDIIATPSRIVEVSPRPPKPRGILWEYVDEGLLAEVPLLKSLKRNI